VQGFVWGPVAAAALFFVIGTLMVISQRSWEPVLHERDAAGMRGEIRANGLLMLSAAAIGSILGASQVLLLAYCAAVGAAAGIALALGLNSGASLVGAILIGSKADWRWSAERRFAVAAIVFGLATIPTALVSGYLPYLIATTIAGFGIAPMFIQQNAVIAERAGGAARSGAFALIGGGVVFGISAATRLFAGVFVRPRTSTSRSPWVIPSRVSTALGVLTMVASDISSATATVKASWMCDPSILSYCR
jgi:hypothetical protein